MSANTVAVLYLISALLFIFALRGLSHPESSRMGNIFGIVGMVIAIFTTLMFKSVLSYYEIGAAILRIVEVIGQDKLEALDEDTLYFIISALNQLDIE